MNSTLTETALKTLVLELRKEFERSDRTLALSPRIHDAVRPSTVPLPLLEVVSELDSVLTLGRSTAESVGAVAPGRLDERTAVGKNFAQVATRLGLEGAQLIRARELPEPYAILDGDRAQVVVRAELLQLLSVAETAFLFSLLLEQTRPGNRLMGSLRLADRALLVPALFAACGLCEAAPGAERMASAIRAATSGEVRAGWTRRLAGLGKADPDALGRDLCAGLYETALRVGLLGAADLRFAARVVIRLDESLPRMQTVGRIEDLDEFIAATPPVRALLAFAVTPQFGELLRAGP